MQIIPVKANESLNCLASFEPRDSLVFVLQFLRLTARKDMMSLGACVCGLTTKSTTWFGSISLTDWGLTLECHPSSDLEVSSVNARPIQLRGKGRSDTDLASPPQNKSPNSNGKAVLEPLPTSRLPGALPSPHQNKSTHSKGKVDSDL